MKAVSTIDHENGTARIELTLERIEDAGEAVNVVQRVAEALYGAIEWTDLPGDAPAAAAEALAARDEAPATGKRKPRDFSRPLKPGSVTALVLEACRRLGTTDFKVIADKLDLYNHVAGVAIAKLRKGGHLP
ncbi:MAG: hypothetical protein ACLPGW_19575 [Roseiarcus sp.]